MDRARFHIGCGGATSWMKLYLLLWTKRNPVWGMIVHWWIIPEVCEFHRNSKRKPPKTQSRGKQVYFRSPHCPPLYIDDRGKPILMHCSAFLLKVMGIGSLVPLFWNICRQNIKCIHAGSTHCSHWVTRQSSVCFTASAKIHFKIGEITNV